MQSLFFPKIFQANSGRIYIYAAVFRIGRDLHIFLNGGQAHLGAIVFAGPEKEPLICSAPGHKDELPARLMAEQVASACDCRVSVAAGIHFDKITEYEINEVFHLCEKLTKQIIPAFIYYNRRQGESDMIDVKNLDQFAEYIRSGALEECFKCGSEETRYQILELLEKLMDVAELADETATHLIFRGLHPMGRHFRNGGNGNGNTLQ